MKVLAPARNLQLSPCHKSDIRRFLTPDIKPSFLDSYVFSKAKDFSYIQIIFSSFIYGKFWKKYFSFWGFFLFQNFNRRIFPFPNISTSFVYFQWKYMWYLNQPRVLNLNSEQGCHLLSVWKRELLLVWLDRWLKKKKNKFHTKNPEGRRNIRHHVSHSQCYSKLRHRTLHKTLCYLKFTATDLHTLFLKNPCMAKKPTHFLDQIQDS